MIGVKKGEVVILDGAYWIVEDYHIQKTAQRRPVLHVKFRNMKTQHVVERSVDEGHQFEQPEVQARAHQYLYHDKSGYVFMDSASFEQTSVPEDLIGHRTWLLKEGAEFVVRFVDGTVFQVVFPPNFVDQVVDTAEAASQARGSNVLKDAHLACGLVIKVPPFIKVGEYVKVDTDTHKYMGKEAGG
jgi:elongation factor P